MSDKLRVALVVPGLEEFGGLPSVTAFLLKIISESERYRADVLSIATSSRDQASVRLVSPSSWLRGPRTLGVRWRGKEYPHIGCYFAELEFQRFRPRKLLTSILNEYDIVHVIGGSPAWANVARECKRPVMLHVATLARLERKALLSRKREVWRRLMTRFTNSMDVAVLPNLHAVFVINAWMYEFLQDYLDPSQVIFAPPGIDTDIFYPGPYRANGYILSVGRFADPRKNVRLLLRAYAHLLQAMPDAPPLILAGDTGPSSENLRLASSLGISEKVEVRLQVSQEELAELYRNASLFVLSSDEEGLGIVNLEAMASGIPVVSTRCGGPDIAVVDGETGYLTPVGDAQALAERMRELLADPSLRQRMGEAGKIIIDERFSLEATGKACLDKYDEVVSGAYAK